MVIALLLLTMAVPLGHREMISFRNKSYLKFQARHNVPLLHDNVRLRCRLSLLKRLAPVRVAVASILCHHLHIGNLYSAEEIANTSNIEVGVTGNDAINAGVDVTLLL